MKYKYGKAVVTKDNAMTVYLATGFWSRLCGLLFRPALLSHEALWISPCSCVHTIGMRYAIDIVFLDAAMNVTAVYQNVRAGRARRCGKAQSVLEMSAGAAAAQGLFPGVKFQFFNG